MIPNDGAEPRKQSAFSCKPSTRRVEPPVTSFVGTLALATGYRP